MNLRRLFMIRFAIGIPMGILIGLGISAISVTSYYADGAVHVVAPEFAASVGSVPLAFFLLALGSGLLGGIGLGCTITYEIETWSLLRATLTHMLIDVIAMFVTGYLLQWWDLTNPAEDAIMLGFFLVSYFIVWSCMCIVLRRRVRQLNTELLEMKKRVH